MSKKYTFFPDRLIVSPIFGEGWKKRKLFSSFRYCMSEEAECITVPKGFVTDYASIPRVFWSLLSSWEKYGPAAIIHDYLYDRGNRILVPIPKKPYKKAQNTRKLSDQIFYHCMYQLGVGAITRQLIYWTVRCFGGSYFNCCKKKKMKDR